MLRTCGHFKLFYVVARTPVAVLPRGNDATSVQLSTRTLTSPRWHQFLACFGPTWNPELLPFQKIIEKPSFRKNVFVLWSQKDWLLKLLLLLYITYWILLIFLHFTFPIFLPRGFCQMLAGCVAEPDVGPQWMWRWQLCDRLRDFLWRVYEAWAVLQMHVHLGGNPLPSIILHKHAFLTKNSLSSCALIATLSCQSVAFKLEFCKLIQLILIHFSLDFLGKGKGGKCCTAVGCVACKAPYVFLAMNDSDSFHHGSCAIQCPAVEKPKMPKNALDLNGQEWPAACFNGTEEQHFFIIGILAAIGSL